MRESVEFARERDLALFENEPRGPFATADTMRLLDAACRVARHFSASTKGSRAHPLGCECIGSNDGVTSCAGLTGALEDLAAILAPTLKPASPATLPPL